MKRRLPHILKKPLLPAFLLAMIFIGSCKTGQYKEQILNLSDKLGQLLITKDSLSTVLNATGAELASRTSDFEKLTKDFSSLESKNKALQTGYYRQGEELRAAGKSIQDLSVKLDIKNAESDSLLREIESLKRQIAAIDSAISATEREKLALAGLIKQKEDKEKADSIAEANKPVPPKENGFENVAELGYAFGLGDVSADYSKSGFLVNNVFGYRINNRFFTGLGTGVNVYNGGTMIPLYLDFRYNFRGGKTVPFVSADGGVLFSLESFGSSGIFINPAVGLSRPISEKLKLNLSTGFYLQEAPSGMRNAFINLKGGIVFTGKR